MPVRPREVIALNPSRSITLHACAAGLEDSEMDLVIMPETSMAKLDSSEFQADQTSQNKIRVSVRSIDSVVASGEALAPSLIKIDVEGAEIFVLRGALETIRSHHPTMFIEVHSSALLAKCEPFLTAEGYTIQHLDKDPAAAKARDVFQIMAFVA